MTKEWTTTVMRRVEMRLIAAFIGMLCVIGSMTAQSVQEPEMVFVAGGVFTMGCTFDQGGNCSYDENPSHEVQITGFKIAKYEVTQALWKQVMRNSPSHFKGDNLPVENVSWDEVQFFIQRLNDLTGKNYRLPTEAEWEYAARGGNQSHQTPFAGDFEAEIVAWYAANSGNSPHAVGEKQPNELGLYDMSGNVWEWCSDYYGDYSSGRCVNPKGAKRGTARVVRGGCYSGGLRQCRVAVRKSLYGGGKDFMTGFRLAMDDDREIRAEAAAQQAEQERIEAEKAAAVAAKQAEQERIAAEKKAEQERIIAEKKAEQERIIAEKKAEQDRIAAEKAAAEAAKQAEKDRIAAEKAAAETAKQAEKDRIAEEKKAKRNSYDFRRLPLFAINVGGGAGYSPPTQFVNLSAGLDIAIACKPKFAFGLYGSYKTTFATFLLQGAAGFDFMMGRQNSAFLLGLGCDYRRPMSTEFEKSKYKVQRKTEMVLGIDLRIGGVFKGFYFFFDFSAGPYKGKDVISQNLGNGVVNEWHDDWNTMLLQANFNIGINFAQLGKKNKKNK